MARHPICPWGCRSACAWYSPSCGIFQQVWGRPTAWGWPGEATGRWRGSGGPCGGMQITEQETCAWGRVTRRHQRLCGGEQSEPKTKDADETKNRKEAAVSILQPGGWDLPGREGQLQARSRRRVPQGLSGRRGEARPCDAPPPTRSPGQPPDRCPAARDESACPLAVLLYRAESNPTETPNGQKLQLGLLG